MTARRKKSKVTARSIIFAIIAIGCVVIARGFQLDRQRPEDHGETHYSQTDNDRWTPESLLTVTTARDIPSLPLRYKGMDISFNPTAHIPNWVAWELTAEETRGTEPRANKFMADPDVEGCAETWDYSYSGYDRGHMAPAGDMKWDAEAMAETFYLTNICPQAKALNTGAWRTLEEKCRQWAQAFGRIYIVCGPVIDGKPMEYIGDSKVYVPSAFFKAVIAPDSSPAMGIGFIMPNSKVKGGMQPCAVSIDSIESLTGHDLFPALPDDIENDIESQCNFNRWATIKTKK